MRIDDDTRIKRNRRNGVMEEPSAVETMSRPDPGGTLAIGAAGTLLVLVAFTTPLTTLVSTAAGLGAGAIGDDYGRRRTFIAGTLLLAGSSMHSIFGRR